MGPSRVFIVDPETSSVDSFSMRDDEWGISALQNYHALRDEVQDAMTESQCTWADTSFSLFAVQRGFIVPTHLL